MDNMLNRLNFDLGHPFTKAAKSMVLKLLNCKVWSRNVVQYGKYLGKYSCAKFTDFVHNRVKRRKK